MAGPRGTHRYTTIADRQISIGWGGGGESVVKDWVILRSALAHARARDMNESRIYQRHRQQCPSNARGPSGWDDYGGGGLICLQQHHHPPPETTEGRTIFMCTYSIPWTPIRALYFMIHALHICARTHAKQYIYIYICMRTHEKQYILYIYICEHTHVINGTLCIRVIPRAV